MQTGENNRELGKECWDTTSKRLGPLKSCHTTPSSSGEQREIWHIVNHISAQQQPDAAVADRSYPKELSFRLSTSVSLARLNCLVWDISQRLHPDHQETVAYSCGVRAKLIALEFIPRTEDEFTIWNVE